MKKTCRIPSKHASRMTAGFFCLLLSPSLLMAKCPPAGQTEASLLLLKKSEFLVADDGDRQALAIGLLDCISDPNPVLRDGIGYEALSYWLRKEQLSQATRQKLLDVLQGNISIRKPDRNGFLLPFSALVLSEVARTDRIKPWMTGVQRNQLAVVTANYLSAISDYRGFDDKQGWRHGVAHASDLAMQLALNPALEKDSLDGLLKAITKQISPTTHSYIHGESERLLRPVLYIAQRDLYSEQEWQDWFNQLLQPSAFSQWEDAFSSNAGLAKRHNLQTFLLLMHANTLKSENKSWQLLNRLSLEALKKMP